MQNNERRVLNAGIGMQNTIEEQDIKTTMMQTFDRLLDILSDHCGPFAKFAIIDDPLRGAEQPTFTMDGINIIKSLEFASPMEEFVKQTVAYIGARTDLAAKDGTTSTMIVSIAALKHMLTALSKYKNISYSDLLSSYETFKNNILDRLEKNKIDIEKNDDMLSKRQLIYSQALISSHGDIELANVVTDLFMYLPKKAWQYITFERESYEKDYKYKFEIEDEQYVMECRPFRNEMLKDNMGTEYISKDASLLVLTYPIIYNTKEYTKFKEIIMKYIEDKKDLVILMPAGMCASTTAELDEIVMKYPDSRVALFTQRVDNPQINDFIILQVLREYSLKTENLRIQEHVSIHYKDSKIKLNNLYEDSDDDIIHPLAKSKSNPVYNDTLLFIEQCIEKLKTQNQNDKDSGKSIMYFQKMYNKLYLTRRAIIKIGGKAYDNKAAIDVCMDTLGAVRNGLLYGFTHAAMQSLYYILKDYQNEMKKSIAFNFNDLYKNIYIESFIKAIEDLHHCILKQATKRYKRAYDRYKNRINKDEELLFNFESGSIHQRNDSYYNLIQPLMVDKSLIERFGEVMLKYLNTVRVINPGAIYVNKENLQK